MLAASLAYYTIFSLAPILLIAIAIANLLLVNGDVQQTIITETTTNFGSGVGDTVEDLLVARTADTGSNIAATVFGFLLLIVGATGVFGQLQTAINEIWGVRPNPKKTSWLRLIWVRLRSLGMILVIGFILIMSTVASAFVSGLQELFGDNLLGSEGIWQTVNTVVSFAIVTVLFALIFKVLPDAIVRWRDVWLGAAFTALLFTIGKFLIGLYLAQSGVSSAYGAAGSLVLLLLWVYYSAQILLLGAEFTQAYAKKYGVGIIPNENAMLTARAQYNLTHDESAMTEPIQEEQGSEQASEQPFRPVQQRSSPPAGEGSAKHL